jgi:hypothetical protein
MQTIEIQTLIDITNTKVLRPNQGSQLALDQQRNFITLNQCLELRSVINYELPSRCDTVDIKDMGFGSAFKGKQKVWTFRFSPDRDNVYTDEQGNAVAMLLDDLHEVPIIKNLTETVNIDKAFFDLKDSKLKNTIIKASPGSNLGTL